MALYGSGPWTVLKAQGKWGVGDNPSRKLDAPAVSNLYMVLGGLFNARF